MSAARDPTSVAMTGAPQVPDFDFVRPIGEGGFGQVWLAINRTTGQPRAVKVISRARVGSRDPAGREIASLVRLEANQGCRHRNLLTIHHVGETDEHLFYVMDLADDLSRQGVAETVSHDQPPSPPAPLRAPTEGWSGEGTQDAAPPTRLPFAGERSHELAAYRPATLESRLAIGPLDAGECERCARELLSGLACLHESGMVHRDVKPANCLYLGGELKLGDFGLLTAAGTTVSRVGTVRYMPPDGCMDARADVYATGLMLYEMLTGMPVDRFPSLGDQASRVGGDRRLARLNRLALRACDPDPSRRFRDAREMLDALAAVETRPAESRWGGWLAVAMGTAVAVVLAFAGMDRATLTDMNFVTEPYEAEIHVDGQLLRTPDGMPYRTPCTVHGLSAGRHHVVFEWDANSPAFAVPGFDGKVDAGEIDFAENRQITARVKRD